MLLVRLREIQFFERPVVFRLPFKFGVVTLTEEPECFVRALVEFESGDRVWGCSAEALAPKWFDKNPALTNDQNFEQLRTALSIAASLYLTAEGSHPPFEMFARFHEVQLETCTRHGLNRLIGSFGPALLDRAILDACCRKTGLSFFDLVRENLPGMQAPAALPELSGFDLSSFLAGLRPIGHIHARHTVGLLDPLSPGEITSPLNDGLPESLEEVARFYGNTYFKVKLQGSLESDLQRLSAIARILDRLEAAYFVTLDGNEQFAEVGEVLELWRELASEAPLRRFVHSILLIEQPLSRHRALAQNVGELDRLCPVVIDESDADLDSFPKARYLGYSGVSSKQCKGLYKAILNSARCHLWNSRNPGRRLFMTGEDLTIQGGVALQQDLALASLLGLHHVERNGHHYVRGLSRLAESEQSAFLENHPDLYVKDLDFVRLNVVDGKLSTASLNTPGLGTAVFPEFSRMRRTR